MKKHHAGILSLVSALGLSAGAVLAQDQGAAEGQDSATQVQQEQSQSQPGTLEQDSARDEQDLTQTQQDQSSQGLAGQEQQDQSQDVAGQEQQSGQEQSPQVAAYIQILEYDDNDDKTLNQEEFVSLYEEHLDQGQSEQASQGIVDRFTQLDGDENGQISSDELADAMPVEEDARNISMSEPDETSQELSSTEGESPV